jgi:hypothetical protein
MFLLLEHAPSRHRRPMGRRKARDRSPSTPLRPSPAPKTAGYNLYALQRGTLTSGSHLRERTAASCSC